jgi:hypothetical protein
VATVTAVADKALVALTECLGQVLEKLAWRAVAFLLASASLRQTM